MEPDRPAAGGELETGLRYYILVDELELGQGMLCESYGVKVTAPDGEEASVRNITVRPERIDRLLELLQRNQVPPVALRDVIDDWLRLWERIAARCARGLPAGDGQTPHLRAEKCFQPRTCRG